MNIPFVKPEGVVLKFLSLQLCKKTTGKLKNNGYKVSIPQKCFEITSLRLLTFLISLTYDSGLRDIDGFLTAFMVTFTLSQLT